MKKLLGFMVLLLLPAFVHAQEKFSTLLEDQYGKVKISPVQNNNPVQVPYLTWGGDVPGFYANGGLKTKPNSIFALSGLNIDFVNGDNFLAQVERYLTGKSPFLRGTVGMLAQASEVICADERTKPIVIVQQTWSAGDHLVAREDIKNINDLKGKKIALQQGGPHSILIDDALKAAKMNWDDIEVIYTTDLSGPNGPATLFKNDSSIAACCTITPDMIGLCSGIDSVGSGAEGTVKGAHVVVSTAQMSRSIADVWVVRKDWYSQNIDFVNNFVAGYLRATEDVVAMRNNFSKTNELNSDYKEVLQLAQNIFTKDIIPTLEEDAHGLLLDATFAGLPGNISFFTDETNVSGFDAKIKSALDLAIRLNSIKYKGNFVKADLDYNLIANIAGIEYRVPEKRERIDAELVDITPESDLDENTIVYFTINFEPNQQEFSAEQYGVDFQRVIEAASTFGNAVVVIEGHSDPTLTLGALVKAGEEKGIIKRLGSPGSFKYYLNGKQLNLANSQELINLINTGTFDGTKHNPRQVAQSALNLSVARADAVKNAIIAFAKDNQKTIDFSQVRPVGVGIKDPIIPKPTNNEEARQNMRVNIRIVKIASEAINAEDFEF